MRTLNPSDRRDAPGAPGPGRRVGDGLQVFTCWADTGFQLACLRRDQLGNWPRMRSTPVGHAVRDTEA